MMGSHNQHPRDPKCDSRISLSTKKWRTACPIGHHANKRTLLERSDWLEVMSQHSKELSQILNVLAMIQYIYSYTNKNLIYFLPSRPKECFAGTFQSVPLNGDRRSTSEEIGFGKFYSMKWSPTFLMVPE
jgi:hypothetical protein